MIGIRDLEMPQSCADYLLTEDQQKKITEIENLVKKLNDARYAYYNGQPDQLTDKEYDDMLAELDQLQKETGYVREDSPVGKVGAATASKGRDVIHEIKARSLDKTKDPLEVIKKLQNEQNCEAVAMWKLDGCTVILTYEDGNLILAATRGDGETGTDITANTKYIAGIPQHINGSPQKLIVRGECVISYTDFDRINSNLPADIEPYANPRNLASASVSMLDPEDMKDRCLQFKAFDVIQPEATIQITCPYKMSNQFEYLKGCGFGVVSYTTCSVGSIPDTIDRFSEAVKNYDIPVDGLVFALNDRSISENLPGTEHHPDPKYGYAFKWVDKTVTTTLRDIEWSPSRTGLLNPVAIFDSVYIAGTTVSRASLHNLSYIKQKWLVKGDTISVYRSNMVIPQILDNLSIDIKNAQDDIATRKIAIDNSIPHMCPTCRGEVEVRNNAGVETVWCTNPNCPEKLIGNLVHFCSRDGLDIDGWSEETIKKLHAVRIIDEFKDIFTLRNNPRMAFMPGFGKKSWTNLYESAEAASSTTFVKFVSALSIPNIGKGQAKVLKKYIDENLEKLQEITGVSTYLPFDILVELALHDFDFTQIKGFGTAMNHDLVDWIDKNFGPVGSTPYKRLMSYITFTDIQPVAKDFMNAPTNSKVAGKTFCITGKLHIWANREELVKEIENNGGTWVDSVSSKTNYLINNDVNSTSGKNKKAHELGIPIISEDEFMNMISDAHQLV